MINALVTSLLSDGPLTLSPEGSGALQPIHSEGTSGSYLPHSTDSCHGASVQVEDSQADSPLGEYSYFQVCM